MTRSDIEKKATKLWQATEHFKTAKQKNDEALARVERLRQNAIEAVRVSFSPQLDRLKRERERIDDDYQRAERDVRNAMTAYNEDYDLRVLRWSKGDVKAFAGHEDEAPWLAAIPKEEPDTDGK